MHAVVLLIYGRVCKLVHRCC